MDNPPIQISNETQVENVSTYKNLSNNGLAITIITIGVIALGTIIYKNKTKDPSHGGFWFGRHWYDWKHIDSFDTNQKIISVNVDLNDPRNAQEIKKNRDGKNMFTISDNKILLKDWINKSNDNKPVLDRLFVKLHLLDGDNKTRLKQYDIYAYIMQDYENNNQKDETNAEFYNKVKKYYSTNRNVIIPLINNKNLFLEFNIKSIEIQPTKRNKFLNQIQNYYKIKQNELQIDGEYLNIIINTIQECKIACLDILDGTKIKYYTIDTIKKLFTEFIFTEKDSWITKNILNVSELSQENNEIYISKFIQFMYNKTMKYILEKALQESSFLDYVKKQISNKTQIQDFIPLEEDYQGLINLFNKDINTSQVNILTGQIGKGSLNLFKGGAKPINNNEPTKEYIDKLKNITYLEWLRRQFILFDIENNSELSIKDVQRKVYYLINKQNEQYIKTKWFYQNKTNFIDSIKNNYEIFKCAEKEMLQSVKDYVDALETDKSKQVLNNLDFKEESIGIDMDVQKNMSSLIGEVSELFKIHSGTYCNFNNDEISKKIKTENITFPIIARKDNSYLRDEVEINYNKDDSEKTYEEDTKAIKEFLYEQKKGALIYYGTCILISVLIMAGLYYLSNKNIEDKERIDNTHKIINYILSIIFSIGIFKNTINIMSTLNELSNTFKIFKIFDNLVNMSSGIKQITENNPTIIDIIIKKTMELLNISLYMATGIVGLFLFINAIGGISALQDFITKASKTNPTTNLSELEALVRSGQSYSLEAAQFKFNPSTGKITTVYRPSRTNYILISYGSHFDINGIYMVIDTNGNITYEVGQNIKLDSLSYIENKPIETALVLAYLTKDKHFSKLTNKKLTKESSDYVFNFEDDGSLILSKKNKDGKLVEIESISMAIREEMQNSLKAQQTKEIVCKEIFGSDNKTCSKHFISILGRAGLNMLQNIGDAVITKASIINNLNNAKVNIKYEILKNLNWKMKNVNEKKVLVSVNEWIKILEEDNKDLGKQYKEYLNKNTLVKDLLESMVDHINNNSRLLEEKYKETVTVTQLNQPITSQKKKRRLSKKQVETLREQVINEKNILNSFLLGEISL